MRCIDNHQAEAVNLRLFDTDIHARRVLIGHMSALQGRTGTIPTFYTADPLVALLYGALGPAGGV